MKKIAMILFITASLGFMYSCGPSAKQIEEKRIADSLTIVAYNDSVTKVFVCDSLAKVKADSLKADSTTKCCKKATKKCKTK